MSVKFKKDLGLKDYLDLIAKQNDAIIDQLMVDENSIRTAFRLTNYNQYKESIKDYTITEKTEKTKEEEKLKDDGIKFGFGEETPIHKSEGSSAPNNIGIIIIIVILAIFIFSIIILSNQ